MNADNDRMKPRIHRTLLALALVPGSVLATEPLPKVSSEAAIALGDYWQGEEHRAFAISPSGAWAWQGELPSAEMARRAALDGCQQHSALPCVPYAVDGQVVFDARTWPTLWRPYASAAHAAQARTGNKRGERLPDLVCRQEDGQPLKLSALRGKLVVLHFWGSWCGPCRRELPSLLRLRDALKNEPGVSFLFVQVREDAKRARAWLKSQKLRLPVCDSGMQSETDAELRVSDGSKLPDRLLASYFPSTYVLDKQGLVLFSRAGPAPEWREYLPFLRDALKHAP